MTGIATGIDPELEQRRALAALFLDQMRPAVIAHFLAAGGIATVGWMRTESLLPWVWYAGLVLILTGRMFLARRQSLQVAQIELQGVQRMAQVVADASEEQGLHPIGLLGGRLFRL